MLSFFRRHESAPEPPQDRLAVLEEALRQIHTIATSMTLQPRRALRRIREITTPLLP